ncbi:hypothetical protein AMTR_s00005p00025520 [Amborella trichopoda]|uniref:Uncharacterized protein n=1 Tax=Amborella trichopoda TaxID=13333 RepID=W1PFK7_AMBTC|nr:hypothetical protein AMTR_s00005p00025520 [Amborella trichopoda]
MASDLGVASPVHEVGPVTVESMHESTLAPSSPGRMTSDSDLCLGEISPSKLGEDEDVNNEGFNTSSEEGPNERFEQPVAIPPNDMDGGVRDEGTSTSQGGEPGIEERLEQPGATTPDVVKEALVPGSSKVEAIRA